MHQGLEEKLKQVVSDHLGGSWLSPESQGGGVIAFIQLTGHKGGGIGLARAEKMLAGMEVLLEEFQAVEMVSRAIWLVGHFLN